MSQDELLILLLKVVLVSGALSVAAFVAVYHYLTRGAVWRDEVGQTIITKDLLLFACLLPSILSLFLSFNRLTSHIAAWTDIALFGLLTPVTLWRIAVWRRIHSRPGPEQVQEKDHDQEGAAT
jgi:hypothetical protein